MSILNNQAEEAAREIAERQEDLMRAELGATDWDETPIVDFVWVRQEPQPVEYDDPRALYVCKGPKLTVERYGSPAPPLEESAIDGEKCEIQRVTRPLYEKMLREHPELFGGREDG